ncbi:hypothetical protein CBL_00909 [Carabus blaptoides fortunei]
MLTGCFNHTLTHSENKCIRELHEIHCNALNIVVVVNFAKLRLALKGSRRLLMMAGLVNLQGEMWRVIIRVARSHTKPASGQQKAGMNRTGPVDRWVTRTVALSGQASGAHTDHYTTLLFTLPLLWMWRTPQSCRHTTCYNIRRKLITDSKPR